MKYEKLSKNALKCMYLATAGGALCVIVAVVAAWVLIPRNPASKIIHAALLLVLILAALDLVISPYFRFNRYRYGIDEECIDIKEGYLFVERNVVPIERLHKVQTQRGPIDQLCHVTKVVVSTAGGDVTIRFLDEDKAEKIADALRGRINEIVREEKRA